ncbi:DUF1893 domain-containing protein [Clostridium sp. Cult2]|uniref:DUF1893 domain-containing protein n=1 Tax=Clostridium sp. Cult2 TaxID=2079003 RepID=UPI001F28C9C1|nr:DUF1893 domain-containing protein [Clostridium sp. Cult2]MCF6465492.1 DUF1893 domain-containing protein [Clostridium sp. Cult2]
MKDIEIAKKYLEEENLCLAVVKDGRLIYKSYDKGIKPIYTLATEMADIGRESSIADRVIGKGAAMLYKYIGVKEIYGKLLSDTAIETLEESNIVYSYYKTCTYIKNWDGTDMCPIEKITVQVENTEELLDRIKDFLKATSK